MTPDRSPDGAPMLAPALILIGFLVAWTWMSLSALEWLSAAASGTSEETSDTHAAPSRDEPISVAPWTGTALSTYMRGEVGMCSGRVQSTANPLRIRATAQTLDGVTVYSSCEIDSGKMTTTLQVKERYRVQLSCAPSGEVQIKDHGQPGPKTNNAQFFLEADLKGTSLFVICYMHRSKPGTTSGNTWDARSQCLGPGTYAVEAKFDMRAESEKDYAHAAMVGANGLKITAKEPC